VPLKKGWDIFGKQVANMGKIWVEGEMMTSWEHDEIMYIMLPSMK
jgi:hypothetical protein